MPRTLRRFLEGKITVDQMLDGRIDMESFCAIASPPNGRFVNFTETDHCAIFYEVQKSKSRFTSAEVAALNEAKRRLGRRPTFADMPENFGMTTQKLTLKQARTVVARILQTVQQSGSLDSLTPLKRKELLAAFTRCDTLDRKS